MAWQDRLKNVAKNLAGATGSALVGYAEQPSAQAGTALQGQDDQDDAPGGSHPDTAIDNPVPDEQSVEDPKSLFWDPFAVIEQLGYKERPSSVTYGTLKAMVWKTPIIHAIIQTRIQQMAAFCQPVKDRYEMGYRVKLRDSAKEPTPEDKKWSQQAETMILRTGVTDNPRGRDTFEKFVRKFMFDSLVLDQGVFEIVPNRRGEPAEWYAIDASTIRLADTASTFLNEDNTEAVRYVQIYDGMIISEYTQKELCFGVRNPRTDIRLFGYGVSEVEMLMSVITAMLFSWTYNQSAFSQGTSQKGILNFKGAIPERQLKAFRRHWYQMVSGVENCLSGDTTIWTPQGGLPISAVIGDKPEVETRVWTGDSWKSALVYRTKEPKKLCHTTLNNGVTVSTSPDHKFRVIGDDGEPTWKRQQELQIGDFVLVNRKPVEGLDVVLPTPTGMIAVATVLKYLRQVRAANDASGKTTLTARQCTELNSVLTGQDNCCQERLIRFLGMVKLPVPQWLQDYHFEPVVEIENTEQLVPMFDLSVYDGEHRFMGNGVYLSNSWRTPITNAEELQWISMQNSNRDMEYSAWMDFLIKVSCGLLTIDPAEVNFKYGNTGQRSQMNESANKEKITESKERGLRPLLRFLETQINQYIIWPLNESFEFKFMGLDSKTRDEMADLNTKLVKTVRTIDELRAEDNLPPLPEGKGEIILDPTWLQFATGKDQAAMQGDPNAPGGDAQPGADGQGDGMDFQQLLAEQEADEADDDDDDADEDYADEQEATAKSLMRESLRKARKLKIDLRL